MKIRENKPALLTILALGLTVMATSSVSACDDEYFARRDSIAIGLGDANATNMAVQTIDPWPPSAHNTRIKVNGKRMHLGVTRYEKNESIPPEPVNATKSTEGGGGAKSTGGGAAVTK